MSRNPERIEATPLFQQLSALRYQAFDNLRRVNGRCLKSAEITQASEGGIVTLFFKEQPILSLAEGFDREALGRALIRHLNAWNQAVFESAKAILAASVELPDNHTWLGQVGIIVNDCWHSNSVSLRITHTTQDMYRPDQYGIEFRMFPRECKAHLFMDYGPQYSFKARQLLVGNEPFVYASTPQEMALELADRCRTGLKRCRESTQC